MNSSSRQQLWLRILDTAATIEEHTCSHDNADVRDECGADRKTAGSLRLSIPSEHDFGQLLSDFPLTTNILSEVTQVYHRNCSSWASTIEKGWALYSSRLLIEASADEKYLAQIARCFVQRFYSGVQQIEDIIRSEVKKMLGAETLRDLEKDSTCSTTSGDDDGPRRGKSITMRSKMILERAFQHTTHINDVEKKELARLTGLEPSQVTVWFQNRRARGPGRRQLKHLASSDEEDSDDSSGSESVEEPPARPTTNKAKRQPRKRKVATLNPDQDGPRRATTTSNAVQNYNKRLCISETRSSSTGSSCSDASGLSAFSFYTNASANSYSTDSTELFSSSSSISGDDHSSLCGETLSADQMTFTEQSIVGVSPAFTLNNPQEQERERTWADPCKSSSLANAFRIPPAPEQQVQVQDQATSLHAEQLPGNASPSYSLSDLGLSTDSLVQSLQTHIDEAIFWFSSRPDASQNQQTLATPSQSEDDEWEDMETDQDPQSSSLTQAPRKNKARYMQSSSLCNALQESPSVQVRASHTDSTSHATPTQASFTLQPSDFDWALEGLDLSELLATSPSLFSGEGYTAAEMEREEQLLASMGFSTDSSPISTITTVENADQQQQQQQLVEVPAFTLKDIEMSESLQQGFSFCQITPASSDLGSTQNWFEGQGEFLSALPAFAAT